MIAFLSCKSNKVTQSSIQHDSVYVERVINQYNAVHDTIVIANPCDSTGLLTQFYSKITAQQGSVEMKSIGGKLQTIVRYFPYFSEKNVRIEYRDRVITKTIYRDKPSNWQAWMWVILFLIGLAYAILNFRPKFL